MPEVTDPEATTEKPDHHAEEAAGGAGRRSRWLVIALYVAAILPVARVVYTIARTTEMPYQDYWVAFAQITNPDGSANLRGFLTYSNEHPFVVPNILYYLNAELFGGTNQGLGYIAVAVTIGCILVLRSVLPPTWSPLARAAMTLAMSATFFVPTGIWNFSRGMSGAAWLTANLFAVTAIALAFRGRTVLATIVAAAAVATYGTGFAAPIAVAVVVFLRRDALWRRLLPIALLAVVGVVYALTRNTGTAGGVGLDPALIASTLLSYLGMLWDPSAGPIAIVAGAGALTVLVLGFLRSWRDPQRTDLIAWWGVAVYVVGAGGLISLARSEASGGTGVQSRYVSLAALLWTAVAVIALRVFLSGFRSEGRVAAVLVTLVVFWASSPMLYRTVLAESRVQDMLAIAVRFDVADPFANRLQYLDGNITRLKALEDYPFNGPFELGCHDLVAGDSISFDEVRPLAVGTPGVNGSIDTTKVGGNGQIVGGWVQRAGAVPQCILMVNDAGKILGAGTSEIPRPDVAAKFPGVGADVGFELVGPSAVETDFRVVVGYADALWELPDSVNLIKPPAGG